MRDIHKVIIIGVSSRVLVIASFVVFGFIYGCSSGQASLYESNPLPIVNLFDRWDSGIYSAIAQNGYPTGYSDVPSPLWAFLPLYPITMKALSLVFAPFLIPVNAVDLAGFFISNISFFVSIFYFYKLTDKIFLNQKIAVASTLFYSFWAGSIVYSGIFSEALFMALMLGAFYYLEENKLKYAVPLGFLAAFTRSYGFLVCIPFVFYAFQSVKDRSKRVKLLFLSAVVASPILIFQIVGYLMAGHFPITVISHNLNWEIYPFIANQFAIYLSDSIALQALYGTGLVLIFLPTAYFIGRYGTSLIKGKLTDNLDQDKKQLKYWAFYGTLAIVILFQSFVCSTLRYAVPMVPICWVSALIYRKSRVAGIVIFGVMVAMLLFSAYLLETGDRFM